MFIALSTGNGNIKSLLRQRKNRLLANLCCDKGRTDCWQISVATKEESIVGKQRAQKDKARILFSHNKIRCNK